MTAPHAIERRQARLMRALATTSALLTALLAVLIANAFAVEVDCRDDRECPRGRCFDGFCVPDPPARAVAERCRIGLPCDDRGCVRHDELLQCVDGRYRKVIGPDVCTQESVGSYLNDVVSRCGNAEQCSAADLKELVISNEQFDQLVRDFGTAFAIHFDSGRPSPRDRSGGSPQWNATRERYIDELAPLIPGLVDTDNVLLIATASKTTRGSGANEELAHRRLREVRGLLREAAKRGGFGGDDMQISDTNLGDIWQRDDASYKQLALSRSIFWEARRERAFNALLDDFDGATAGLGEWARERQRAWRDQVMNQAVFVIPNPCKLGDDSDGH